MSNAHTRPSATRQACSQLDSLTALQSDEMVNGICIRGQNDSERAERSNSLPARGKNP